MIMNLTATTIFIKKLLRSVVRTMQIYEDKHEYLEGRAAGLSSLPEPCPSTYLFSLIVLNQNAILFFIYLFRLCCLNSQSFFLTPDYFFIAPHVSILQFSISIHFPSSYRKMSTTKSKKKALYSGSQVFSTENNSL